MAGWRSREMEVRRNSLLNYTISEPANKKISGSVSRRFNGNTDQSGRSSKMAKMCLCLRPGVIRAPIQRGEKKASEVSETSDAFEEFTSRSGRGMRISPQTGEVIDVGQVFNLPGTKLM